ncbi:hypothetical protein LTS15_004955 [Exophiala xenobiotica]|nr:hypothetical protein LTS15_004955 [Exophiala xenobiotica]
MAFPNSTNARIGSHTSKIIRTLSILSILLGTQIKSTTAGNCFSDQSEDLGSAPTVPTKVIKKCLNGPAAGELWACQDPSIDFPTVECLTADIKTCGILGADNAPSIFYSFGVDEEHINSLRDQVTPLGNLYRDMLDDDYTKTVLNGRYEPFRLDIRARAQVFLALSIEAYATILKDMTSDMQASQTQLFAPVATVYKFDTEQEAIKAANKASAGLAGYVYTSDIGRAWRTAEALQVGMTGVNTGIMLDPYAPFGGIKETGFGREGGRHGIEGVPNQQDNHSWRSGVTIK